MAENEYKNPILRKRIAEIRKPTKYQEPKEDKNKAPENTSSSNSPFDNGPT